MNKTLIEWVKNPDGTQGYTWNPITGCLNGCEYCYARKLANGRLRSRYLANKCIIEYPLGKAGDAYADPFFPRFWDLRLVDPYAIKKPCGVFTVDMGELFGNWIPENWQQKIFAVIKSCPQHRFYLLTKQPQNLIKFSPFPDNCWVGVTVTNADMLIDAVKAFNIYTGEGAADAWFNKWKYISFEPLLSDMKDAEVPYGSLDNIFRMSNIRWVIIGAQTKPYKPPKIEWVTEIIRACDKAQVPVFLKDNLGHLLQYQHAKNLQLTHRPDEHGVLVLRQEMPRE